MTTNIPIVTVIIPTYKNEYQLEQCLHAIALQDFPLALFEVIVVNNDISNIEVNDKRSNVKIIQETRPGSYAARNRGIEKASGKILAFTDDDCIPDQNWLSEGVAFIEKNGPVRVAGKISLFFSGRKKSAVECYEAVFAFNQKKHVESGVSLTANLFVPRKVFHEVGFFDGSLYSGGDVAWSAIASKHGIPIHYLESVIIKHPARRTWLELSRKTRRTLGGRLSLDPNYRISLLKTLAPPLHAIKEIFRNRNLSRHEKFLAISVAYRLKIYRYVYLSFLLKGSEGFQRV